MTPCREKTNPLGSRNEPATRAADAMLLILGRRRPLVAGGCHAALRTLCSDASGVASAAVGCDSSRTGLAGRPKNLREMALRSWAHKPPKITAPLTRLATSA